MAFWFCLTHMEVEPDAGCAHQHRLGPYADEAAAAKALQRAQERNEEWDRDPAWNDRWDTEAED